jgi:hypothetical protein
VVGKSAPPPPNSAGACGASTRGTRGILQPDPERVIDAGGKGLLLYRDHRAGDEAADPLPEGFRLGRDRRAARPCRDLSAALAGEPSGLCLRELLLLVPDPRKRAGRWHPLEFVLVLAVCAFTAAGHDSPTAIAEWAAGCPVRLFCVCSSQGWLHS